MSKVGNISRRNEMPMNYSLVIEPFDCWGFDFMGHFPPLESNTHILVAVAAHTTNNIKIM